MLSTDVVTLILKKLPIETRVALRVEPNRVIVSADVSSTVARMARVAAHPNHLRWTWARIDGEPSLVRVISMRTMTRWLDIDGVFGDPYPEYCWMAACRTRFLRGTSDEFCPMVHSAGYYVITPPFRRRIEMLEEYEANGEIC